MKKDNRDSRRSCSAPPVSWAGTPTQRRMVRVLLVGQVINEKLGEQPEELQSADRACSSLRRQRFRGDSFLTNQSGLV